MHTHPHVTYMHAHRTCTCRWTVASLADKFRIRRQRVLAILALKVGQPGWRGVGGGQALLSRWASLG